MRLIVGLGNPGARYVNTRHNVGFEVLARLARRWHASPPRERFQAELSEAEFAQQRCLLAAPLTYMNHSGLAVQQLVHFYRIPWEAVLIICDDMNLPVGHVRLRAEGSAGGQKGLHNILSLAGTTAVPRLRIGVGRPPPQHDPADYVLGKIPSSQLPIYDQAFEKAVEAVEWWTELGIDKAMSRTNTRPPPPPEASSTVG
ncbi:MAG: peptidyl-tRNA hydrolase [Planctomycetaceae bacterium]|nr:MAG: peptidyl-tRNA hydrolase [Planctomycetaceae bacterium]